MDSEANNQQQQKLHFWVVLIGLFTISLIAGVIGFERYYNFHSLPHNLVNSFYNALQLYVLESENLRGWLPFELNFARFAAPLVSLLAIIITLMQIFKQQWKRFKISIMRNHIVVIGHGTIGKNITDDLLKKNKKVLVIDIDADHPDLILQQVNFRIITADASKKEVLKKANIVKADYVYLTTGNDNTQIKICLEIYQLLKASKRKKQDPLKCFMHLHKQELMNTIKSHKLVQDIDDAFSLRVFNIYESSARDLFEDHPPDRNGISENSKAVIQFLIFGFGPAGESLALQTALTGHYANGKKPKIVVFDSLVKEKTDDFLKKYPAFSDYCNLEYIDIISDSPQIVNTIQPYTNIPDTLTTIVLCYEHKTQNLLLGLQLDNVDFNEYVKIFIMTSDDITFKSVSQKLKLYGHNAKVCSHEAICNEMLDKKAIAFHNNYLEKRKTEKDFGKKHADVPWEELSQEYKDSNRKAADHIGVKMRAIGCEIVNTDDPRSEAEISEEELFMLAKLEHKRWMAERLTVGWTYGKTRNDKTRETPDLTAWEKLTDEVKEYDINAVKSIPEVLAKVGLKTVRK